MERLTRKRLFNPDGDTAPGARRIIGGNTTNLNDFNNMKYQWASDWYRQAMNNFWIPEEISMAADVLDYPRLTEAERYLIQLTMKHWGAPVYLRNYASYYMEKNMEQEETGLWT